MGSCKSETDDRRTVEAWLCSLEQRDTCPPDSALVPREANPSVEGLPHDTGDHRERIEGEGRRRVWEVVVLGRRAEGGRMGERGALSHLITFRALFKNKV